MVPAVAAREPQPSHADGTVLRIVAAPTLQEAMSAVDTQFGATMDESAEMGASLVKQYAAFRTNAISGESQIIWLDLSWLTDSDHGGVVHLDDGESILADLHEQPDGSLLAIRHWALRKGSKLNDADWGVQEANTARDDSIEARVDTVPDDEARAQGDRFDEKGREVEDDDD